MPHPPTTVIMVSWDWIVVFSITCQTTKVPPRGVNTWILTAKNDTLFNHEGLRVIIMMRKNDDDGSGGVR